MPDPTPPAVVFLPHLEQRPPREGEFVESDDGSIRRVLYDWTTPNVVYRRPYLTPEQAERVRAIVEEGK